MLNCGSILFLSDSGHFMSTENGPEVILAKNKQKSALGFEKGGGESLPSCLAERSLASAFC